MATWIRDRAATLSGACAVALAVPAWQLEGGSVHALEVAFVVAFLVISVVIHEVAHAVVADWRGDSTARDLGRITLNPIPHIDPFMTILLPAALYFFSGGSMVFGGAKPVPVNFSRLRNPLRDMSLVAIAGPASNFLLAIVFLVAWKASVYLGDYERASLLPRVLIASMYTNLWLAAFNMLPIPPLDGSRVMTWLLPSGLRAPYAALERFGLLIVVLAWYWVPAVQETVFQAVTGMRDLINIATGGRW